MGDLELLTFIFTVFTALFSFATFVGIVYLIDAKLKKEKAGNQL